MQFAVNKSFFVIYKHKRGEDLFFKGVCTALVTPFQKNCKIDYLATERLLEHQINGKISAIMVLGSTGEGFLLNSAEKQAFVKFVKSTLPSHIKLVVSVGENKVNETVKEIKKMQDLGVEACLIHTPYFVKCTQNALVDYFAEIDKKTNLPAIVYNIPSRSGVNILPQTMKKIADFSNIVGLKEANTNIDHICQMFHEVSRKIDIYCGNDNLNCVFKGLGGSGTISVTSNAFPAQMQQMFQEDNLSLQINDRFFEFNNLIFCEPNPIPIKYVLSKMGIIENNLRKPLSRLEDVHKKELDRVLQSLR